MNTEMKKRSVVSWWRLMVTIATTLVLGIIARANYVQAASPAAPTTAAHSQVAPDQDGGGDDGDDDNGEENEFFGVISELPAVLQNGNWVIGSETFVVSSTTELDDHDQTFAVGVKVKVHFTTEDNVNYAREIEIKGEGDHDGGDHDGEESEFFGVILELPPVLQNGNWVIGGETFVVSTTTKLEDHGQMFAMGVKVKVHFTTKENVNYAREIEIKVEGDDDNDGDGGHHEGDDDDIKIYARLESRPDEKVGVWVIGGTSYTVTESTELKQDYGTLVVGICVEVEVRESSPTVAKEIESEEEYKCTGHDDDDNSAHGQLFGVISELPADLQNGEWVIGGRTFVVSTTTDLKSRGLTFAVGVTVQVHFSTDSNDVNYARKIEIKFGHYGYDGGPNGDHDDDEYGNRPGEEGKAYGLIVSRPVDTNIGEWNIGGIVYLATERTRFDDANDDGDDDFLVGERVKIEYVVNEDGSRRATEIEETDDTGGVIQPGNDRLVGFVEAKPDAFIGPWTVAGAEFVTTADTIFREQGGVFAVGSYVIVEYSILNDQRVVHGIATHIPPGAGDDNIVGLLEAVGGAQIAALPNETSATWTVNGETYVVTAATQLVEIGGELLPGSEVYVNSYIVDGQKVATMIRAVSSKAFMPMMQR